MNKVDPGGSGRTIRGALKPGSATAKLIGIIEQSPKAKGKADAAAIIKALHEDSFTPATTSAPSTSVSIVNQSTPPQGGGVNPNGLAKDAKTPEEAAARLKNQSNYGFPDMYGPGDSKERRGRDYLATIEAHKNDPNFLREMYKALGADATSRVLGDAAQAVLTDAKENYIKEAEGTNALKSAGNSLGLMSESFQREVGRAAAINCPGAALVLKNGTCQAAKLGFVDGMKDVVTADPKSGDGVDRRYVARMAGEVIASDPSILKHVADTWKSSDVSALLKNGLEWPPYFDENVHWKSFTPNGLERLVAMTADLKGEQYADFRARVFRDASLALGNSRAGDPDRKGLVESLKKLFQSDAPSIVSKLFNNTGDPDGPFDFSQKALGLLFRDALFSKPDKSDPFNQFVSSFMADLHGQMLDPSKVDHDPRTLNNNYFATQLSNVLGSIVAGYTLAVKQNGEDQAAREALASTIVDMVASNIPGGGPLGDAAKDKGKEFVGEILGDFINGDLKANKEGMTELMKTLLNAASAGAQDFDKQYDTTLENTLKTNPMWIDFISTLFER